MLAGCAAHGDLGDPCCRYTVMVVMHLCERCMLSVTIKGADGLLFLG